MVNNIKLFGSYYEGLKRIGYNYCSLSKICIADFVSHMPSMCDFGIADKYLKLHMQGAAS